jgi:hypothetical protein
MLDRDLMRSSTAIGKLIDAYLDDQHMLEHESRTVGPRRKIVLDQIAAERRRFGDQLRDFAVRGEARLGTLSELVREVGRDLRFAVGGRSDGDAVHACRRSCTRSEARLDQALELPMSEPIREVLLEQRARLDQDHKRLLAIQY